MYARRKIGPLVWGLGFGTPELDCATPGDFPQATVSGVMDAPPPDYRDLAKLSTFPVVTRKPLSCAVTSGHRPYRMNRMKSIEIDKIR